MNEPMNDKVVEGSLFAVADQPISGFAWPCFACKHQNIDCKTLGDCKWHSGNPDGCVLVNRSELKRLICERGVTCEKCESLTDMNEQLQEQLKDAKAEECPKCAEIEERLKERKIYCEELNVELTEKVDIINDYEAIVKVLRGELEIAYQERNKREADKDLRFLLEAIADRYMREDGTPGDMSCCWAWRDISTLLRDIARGKWGWRKYYGKPIPCKICNDETPSKEADDGRRI